ncbi:cytochrome oxidase assembly protein 1 [Taxawa tesnikishii (nom. ined.)]|nr:cytochrome oxidase assembly protein 1 [Dothideales sp. JES 119]
MPIFIAVMTVSTLAIFNYQKSSSSVVSSTLYALRTNSEARAVLGDEVYFASKMPWIGGELNQLHGRININFWVKGTKQKALMKFRSERKTRMGLFETLEWTLQTEDGRIIDLLQGSGADPFQQTPVAGNTQGLAA